MKKLKPRKVTRDEIERRSCITCAAFFDCPDECVNKSEYRLSPVHEIVDKPPVRKVHGWD